MYDSFWKILRPSTGFTVTFISQKYHSLSVVSKYEHHQPHDNLRKFLMGFFILQKQWDPNFLHDHFSKISRTFFINKCGYSIELDPYSHYRFPKILRFCVSRN